MDTTLENVGVRSWYSSWAVFFLVIGVLFVIIFPHPAMIVFGLPVPLAIAMFAFWLGFYRNPNVIVVTDHGIELRFRSKKPRYIPWEDVERIEMPVPDPIKIRAKPLSLAGLKIEGEADPFALTVETAKVISDFQDKYVRGHVKNPELDGPSAAPVMEI